MTRTAVATDEVPELVGMDEIAERGGVSKQTVRSWVRRHETFPQPVASLAVGRIWAWADVERWITQHDPSPGRKTVAPQQ